MNNLFSIFFILFLFYIILIARKESFEVTNEQSSYYIDDSGEHAIEKLPLELKDILELKYINTTKNETKFVLTKGSYKHSESKNEIKIVNDKAQKYQRLFLKSESPFSGILF